jgi:putative DNA primase/helicase
MSGPSPPKPPNPPPIHWDSIPAELRDRAQWVVWVYHQRGDKWTKVPLTPGRSGQAKTDDPSTWRPCDEARAAYDRGGLPGVGYVFSKKRIAKDGGAIEVDDPYTGIDLDKCRNPDTGVIAPEAMAIVRKLDSYTEVSPSGTGLHVIVRGALPGGLGRRIAAKEFDHLEYYDRGRYFTMSGSHLPGTPASVQSRQAELDEVIAEYGGAGAATPGPMPSDESDPACDSQAEPSGGLPERVAALLESNQKFAARWGGSTKGLKDASRSGVAESLVCMMLSARIPRADIDAALRIWGQRTGYDRPADPRWRETTIGNAERFMSDQEAKKRSRRSGAAAGQGEEAGTSRELKPLIPGVNAGQITPTGLIVLTPGDPMQAARALVFTRYRSGDDRVLHHHRDGFHEWNGRCYLEVPDREARAVTWRFLDGAKALDAEGNLVPFTPTKHAVDGVTDALKAEVVVPGTVEPPAWIGTRPEGAAPADQLVACANGLLHPPTKLLVPHSPRFFCPNALPFDFLLDAPPPECWLRFMDDCFPDDSESIGALQEAMGYTIGNDTSQQKGFMFIGPKRSGKGTIAAVWEGLLGKASVATPTLASMAERFGLWPLIGKRLAIFSDARLSGRADQTPIVERILSITGEDSQTIDRKHQTAWIGRLPTVIVLMSNETPKLGDASGAVASRFITWEMGQSFYGREDPGLKHRLLVELPGILVWALQGRARLYKRGRFIQPVSGEGIAADLAELTSPILTFVGETCILGSAFSTPLQDMYDAWCIWCRRQGREHPGTVQSFGRDLRAAESSLRDVRPRAGGCRVRCYEGIRLNPTWSALVRDWSATNRSQEPPI